jgi:endonuclease-3
MAESLALQRTGSKAAVKERALQTVAALRELYPDAECALRYSSPLELLVAVILSAQCTDERVNIVTEDLFRKYRKAADYAKAPLEELEQAIRSTGFYRNKAKNIQACCRALVEQHGGEVPQDLQALVVLAGVGRKTANVVLGTAFGIPSGVVVDTHVTRLSNRLGLTKQTDAVKIEQDLIKLLPPEEWIDFSHRLIWHGRRICTARKPLCEECLLASFCPKIGVAKKLKGAKSAVLRKPRKKQSAAASAGQSPAKAKGSRR